MAPDTRAEVIAFLQELSEDPAVAIQRLVGVGRRRGARREVRREAPPVAELAEAYRYDLAVLLGRATLRRMYTDAAWSGILHRSVYSGQLHEVPSLEGLRAERDSVGRLARLDTTAWSQGNRVLDESPPCTSLDLALAALRIFRHDNAAIMAGLELARLGRWRDSWQLLDQVTAHSSSSFLASCAWEAKGFLHLRRKEPVEATSAFRNAADVESDRPAPLCAWFVLGSSSSDLRQVEESASRLREMIDESDPSVGSCISFFRALRQEGLFEPQMKTASALAHSPATQRIVHELS